MKNRTSNIFYSKEFCISLIILWAIALVFVLLWLQGITGENQQLPISAQAAQPSGHGPYSFVVSMGTDRLGQTDTFLSPAILLENGRTLGPGNTQPADIGQMGDGRFSFRKGHLNFSSSDNSDPRTNGRNYMLVLPRPVAPRRLGWVLFLSLAPLIWLIWSYFDILVGRIRISPGQVLGSAIFGLAVSLSYLFLFFWHDSLRSIYLSSMILLQLWCLFSVLVYWAQIKFLKLAPGFIFGISIIKIFKIFNQVAEESLQPDVQNYRIIAENMKHIYDTNMREPVFIWFVKISLAVFGHNDFALRFLGIALFLITAFGIYRLVLDSFDDRFFALVALALFSWNRFLIDLAVQGLRDNLFVLAVIGITYFTFSKAVSISNKMRFLGTTLFLLLAVGTRITSIFPLALIAGYTFLKHKIRLSLSLLTFFVIILIIGPYLYYSYVQFGDPFLSANIHAKWWRNYEFVVLKGTGCDGCPSLEEFQASSYSGEPTTMSNYIFGLHPVNELIIRSIQGFQMLNLSPSPFFVTLAGLPHGSIMRIDNEFIDYLNFRQGLEITIFIVYIIGLCAFLFLPERLIVLIPLVVTNISLFIVYAMPLRIYSLHAPFIHITIAYGVVFIMRWINRAINYIHGMVVRNLGSGELLPKYLDKS